MTPDWIKGDVVVWNGCCVFIAEYNPHYENGKWLYGFRDCRELRRATPEDIERLIGIAQKAILREANELSRLLSLKDKIEKERNNAQH